MFRVSEFKFFRRSCNARFFSFCGAFIRRFSAPGPIRVDRNVRISSLKSLISFSSRRYLIKNIQPIELILNYNAEINECGLPYSKFNLIL